MSERDTTNFIGAMRCIEKLRYNWEDMNDTTRNLYIIAVLDYIDLIELQELKASAMRIFMFLEQSFDDFREKIERIER